MRHPGSTISLIALLALMSPRLKAAAPAPGERDTPDDRPRATQREDKSPPPAAPEATPTDPGAVLPPLPPVQPPGLHVRHEESSGAPAQTPAQFNPDPGAALHLVVPEEDSYFKTSNGVTAVSPEQAPVPADRALPRAPLERPRLEPNPSAPPPSYGLEPLSEAQKLPRAGTRENRFIPKAWTAPEDYPLARAGAGYGPNSTPVPDRWRNTGFTPWRRYTSGDTNELPYYYTQPDLWHYYRQSLLKGDLPIRGPDIFLSLTASSESVYEDRKVTLPSNVSSARAGSFDFFGDSRTRTFTTDAAFQIDLFKGETVFKPVEWEVRIKPVFNFNRLDLRETLVSPDPRGSVSSGIGTSPSNAGVVNPGDVGALLGGGLATAPGDLDQSPATNRNKTYVSLQEAFIEKHLADLSANYDFCAIKVGNQSFNSDFRGFIFNDTNLGARFFGNYDDNRWQYNLALFDLREKDTNSELNTFDRRGQIVAIANVYRQDFWKKGYTAELSVHASFDQGDPHYDTNGAIVRPAPIGTVVPHRVDSYYLGWTGDGHLGRWNVSHAVYLVTGRDDFNGLAGQPVDIFAQMAAVEVSYDRDWIRYKASFFYASGDHNTENGRATGFDSIVDNTNFTGGPFSYYARQGFNLAGTSVGLKQRFSLLPDLRTSKTEGQQNFVNPGLLLPSLGATIDVTPKLRAFVNANYIRFVTTDPLKTALLTNQVDARFGTDLSLGFQWRPLLTDNIIFSAGYGALLPARGFRDIFRTVQPAVPGFTATDLSPEVDRFLYSAVVAVTLTH